MRRLATRVLLLATAALVVSSALGAAPAPAACHAGVHQVSGVTARTFCGGATVTARIGNRTVTLRGGECARTASYFSLNVGTVVLGTVSKRPDYAGIAVGAVAGGPAAGKDGTYHKAALVVTTKNKGYALTGSPKVVLKGGRTKGTFSGTTLTGTKVSGSFTCG